eukprot:TRINITY_DN9815_c0_g1_i3.p1 TRINITY_DN9815_c0_g1~~TRINITY_DN9815_c0_g1_i3.p1  ORF type:complete len:147 (-),score=46.57 TRINITY_DN9815_c0_g1_i3:396-773(-)
MKHYGGSLSKVTKKLPGKTMKDVIEYFYIWKKKYPNKYKEVKGNKSEIHFGISERSKRIAQRNANREKENMKPLVQNKADGHHFPVHTSCVVNTTCTTGSSVAPIATCTTVSSIAPVVTHLHLNL